jgi:hypothetical protein
MGTLAEACQKTDWQLYGSCLMSIHFYLVAMPTHTGEEVRQSAQAKAGPIMQEELRALGWTAADSGAHRRQLKELTRAQTPAGICVSVERLS